MGVEFQRRINILFLSAASLLLSCQGYRHLCLMNFCLCCLAFLFCLTTQQGQNLTFLNPFVAMEMTLLSQLQHYDISAGWKMRHTRAVRVWCFQQICNDKSSLYEGPNLHTLKSMGDLPITTVFAAGLCRDTTKQSLYREILIHGVQLIPLQMNSLLRCSAGSLVYINPTLILLF